VDNNMAAMVMLVEAAAGPVPAAAAALAPWLDAVAAARAARAPLASSLAIEAALGVAASPAARLLHAVLGTLAAVDAAATGADPLGPTVSVHLYA
jgi:hypothetical protein